MGKRRRQGPKQPRVKVPLSTDKHPRASPAADVPDLISWRFSEMDLSSEWGCHNLTSEKLLEVREKLLHFESQTWDQCAGTGSAGVAKRIPLDDFPTKTKRRFEDLGVDDAEALHEFRLSGPERVWGIRRGSVCYILWWDPKHEVFPTKRT